MRHQGTCIVAVKDRGVVHFGADSLVSSEYNKFTSAQTKLVRLGDLLVGVCGSIRVYNVVACDVTPPTRTDNKSSDYRYIVSSLVPELRERLRAAGALMTENGFDSIEAHLLIGYRGNIYWIDDEFQVIQPDADYWAAGSGREYALGSLYSSRTLGDPRQRIQLALEAASAFVPSVAAPYVFESIGQASGTNRKTAKANTRAR